MKKYRIIITLIAVFSLVLPVNSEENKNAFNEHEINFYTGMFDFSDDGQKAGLFGIQHRNENLTRNYDNRKQYRIYLYRCSSSV